ncbi:MAG TPA: hypothetical protein VMF58_09750 [Rhizomicrobium sp.]|nr:hypothetical protein [Rhizomicrobium sp.]
MKIFGLLIAVVTIALTGAAQAETCTQPIKRAAALVLDANRTLNALPVSQDTPTNVSPAGQTAIAAMKDRLNDYIVATMRCTPDLVVTADMLMFGASDVQRDLEGFAGVKPPEDKLSNSGNDADGPRYGGKVKFDVDSRPGLLAIVARFGIACGEDAMLTVFERRDNTWVEVLRTQSAPYKTVAGGWWSLDYRISPRNKDGNWFVVTKTLAPWCSSTWSEIRYAVLRTGKDAAHPRTLLSKSDSIWWGADRYGDLKVDANSFDLRWRAESMDDGVHNREWIAHYIVEDSRAYRTAPIAESPRDFADEWLRLDWNEAKHWTAVAHYGLKPLHDRLQKIHGFEYVAIRRCRSGMDTEGEVEPILGADDRHVFFEVGTYPILQMGNVSYAADPGCKGANLYNPGHPQ